MLIFVDIRLTLHIGIDCSKDFYGKQCKVYCKDSDDQTGHYNCEDDGHKLCMKGWKGSNCTEQENACDGNSCQNNATCYITKGPIATYRCECTSAYTGTYCTERWNILRNATIAQETSTLAPTTRVHPKPTPAYTASTRPPTYSKTCTPSQALQFGIDGQTSSPDVVRNDIKRFLSERGVSDIYNVDIIEKDISGYRHPHVLITPLRQPNITENIELLIIEHVKHLTGHHPEEPHCVDMKQPRNWIR
ncbi:delta-like protein 1 [Haliotis rufescens]|uniref:delta-like protein 1 n=1 Tax=Haliotis rufescens TaxID=6454 RepID=UPI00201F9B71|nr:delta-like protein 1 [Haliotis rufescens]